MGKKIKNRPRGVVSGGQTSKQLSGILKKLTGGDRRSIGRVDEVVAEVLNDPKLFDTVFKGLLLDDPVVRMRAADAIEKITVEHSEYLQPYKTILIQHVAKYEQQEVRWHLAQLFPRLDLTTEECKDVVAILKDYLSDESKIVKTFSMQALADLAAENPDLYNEVIALLEDCTRTGSPAMKSRARILLKKMKRDSS